MEAHPSASDSIQICRLVAAKTSVASATEAAWAQSRVLAVHHAIVWGLPLELTSVYSGWLFSFSLSKHCRAIPGSYWSAPWYNKFGNGPVQTLLPMSSYEQLSEFGRKVAARLASDTEELRVCGAKVNSTATARVLWKPDWDTTTNPGKGGGGDLNNVHTGDVLPKL